MFLMVIHMLSTDVSTMQKYSEACQAGVLQIQKNKKIYYSKPDRYLLCKSKVDLKQYIKGVLFVDWCQLSLFRIYTFVEKHNF